METGKQTLPRFSGVLPHVLAFCVRFCSCGIGYGRQKPLTPVQNGRMIHLFVEAAQHLACCVQHTLWLGALVMGQKDNGYERTVSHLPWYNEISLFGL